MRRIILSIGMLYSILSATGQPVSLKPDSIAMYFKDAELSIRQNSRLWNMDFYGPVMLVNPATREMYTNYPDKTGALKKQGDINTGHLPAGINIANYVVEWNGLRWAMIMTNLIPARKEDRVNLFAHELFHRVQQELGFILITPDNSHLDKKNGRIFLRLELEALKRAALVHKSKSVRRHLTNAFLFRKYRHQLFPGSDTAENWLELNEGITEYTGLIIDGRNQDEAVIKLVRKIEGMQTGNVSFVRNFAYATTPVHGYLLRKSKRYWNKEIDVKTDLTGFFVNQFRIRLPAINSEEVLQIANEYNAGNIFSQENLREESILALVKEYAEKLVSRPHIEIPCYALKFTANTGTQLVMENQGAVYQSFFSGADDWGTLLVEKGGVLVAPGKKRINISLPVSIDSNTIKGETWVLKLNDGYTIEKDTLTGNFLVFRKQQ